MGGNIVLIFCQCFQGLCEPMQEAICMDVDYLVSH